MNALSDPQLLRAYVERRSEASFAELVRRHIDLVHSAALRMVNDLHLAKDVSQAVFVALAKDAAKLTDHPVLSGWLHRTARNIAAQTVRTEVRRRNREQEVAAMNEHPETDAAWEEIAPHLDAALAELSEPDRDAVLLRYFENKPAQEMATILGISAEAAQKRVSRAVEKLRESFAKRGVSAGTAGLAGVISANAVQAAPVGLACAISTTAFAGTVASASSAVVATKSIAMTSLQKAIIASAITVSLATAIYQTSRASKLQAVNEEIQQTNARFVSNEAKSHTDQQTAVYGSKARKSRETRTPQLVGATGEPLGNGAVSVKIDEMFFDGRRTGPLPYYMVNGSGRLTIAAAEAALLTENEKQTVQTIIDSTFKKAEEDALSRLNKDESNSSSEKGVFIFYLPASSDRARGLLLDFNSSLNRSIGRDRSAMLCKTFGPDNCVMGLGRFDIRFEVKMSDSANQGQTMVYYTKSNPENGKVAERGYTSVDAFHLNFGTILEFDAD